jgi:hypothetical protein
MAYYVGIDPIRQQSLPFSNLNILSKPPENYNLFLFLLDRRKACTRCLPIIVNAESHLILLALALNHVQ